MTAARVIVVDDQTVVREGLVLILGMLPGVVVAGAAGNGEEALRLVTEARPDVVLMDLRMPRMDGVQATKRIRAEHPDTRVVVLTTYSDDESVLAALRAGAHGYLTKNARSEDIAQAITDVLGGESHLDPVVQRRLVELATNDRPPSHGLTPRELQVLRLIAEGRSNTEIARQLYITEGTVKTHVNNLFAKAGVRDRAQAVTYAFRHGFAPARTPE
jgi:DNA-binding NarL/FixJ family response regulator